MYGVVEGLPRSTAVARPRGVLQCTPLQHLPSRRNALHVSSSLLQRPFISNYGGGGNSL